MNRTRMLSETTGITYRASKQKCAFNNCKIILGLQDYMKGKKCDHVVYCVKHNAQKNNCTICK